MSMFKEPPPTYEDGMTKQAFKDSTDINKILKKAQRAGSLSHLVRHGATYGDFTDVDGLLDASLKIQRGQEIFDELPSELRREFGNQFDFFRYVNDPANSGRLEELLPAAAAPGRQVPAVRRSAATEANPAVVSAPTETPPAPEPAAPQGASDSSVT